MKASDCTLYKTKQPTHHERAVLKLNIMIQLIKGDCLVEMQNIPDKSIDCIICDLPYGTTACKWDVIIPFDLLWAQYKRVIKDNGAIVLFGSQPFTSSLVMSNPKMFKYDIAWIKERPSNPALANKRPLNYKEDILIFYKNQPTFNPQKTKREEKNKRNNKNEKFSTESSAKMSDSFRKTGLNDLCFPKNYLKVNVERGLHPTQKPQELIKTLIRTFSNENEVILDNCLGSGTTAIAAINTNRKYIGFEMDKTYFDIAQKRIQNAQTLFLSMEP